MRSALMASALAFAVAGGSALAQEFGSADEARAMLEQAVAALEADEAAALAAFTAGDAPFRDRDLYVFCGGPDGLMSAHGADAGLVGRDVRALVDVAGTRFGEAFYDSAVAGELNTVEYLWPRPGGDGAAAEGVLCDDGGRADVRCGVLSVTCGWRAGPRSFEMTSAAVSCSLPALFEVAALEENLGLPRMSVETATAGVTAAIEAILANPTDIDGPIRSRLLA